MTSNGTASDEKKDRERQIIETARKLSTYFPSGDLCPDECLDWVIPSASLGIEVSELLPAKRARAKFSGPQVAAFQKRVIEAAEQYYRAVVNGPPADVLVFYRNDWACKRGLQQLA